MPREQGKDPLVWLAAAREHLVVVEHGANPNRIRCFSGQRAAELALKAILIHDGVAFPRTHKLEQLSALLPDPRLVGLPEAAVLTPYAVEEMYPDTFTTLDGDHVEQARATANAVVGWASRILEPDA